MRAVLRASESKRRTITTAKKGKTDRQKIVAKLDALVSRYIRARDGACVICGTSENLQCGHLFSRTSFSTRWDIRKDGNCHTQCRGCNLRHEHDAAPYTLWYIHEFGLNQYEKLYAEYRSVAAWSTSELEFLFLDLKRKTALVP